MKKQNKLISRFLAIFILLWIGGMNVWAQCDCDTAVGEECFTVIVDAEGENPEGVSGGGICLSPTGSGLTSYCVLPGSGIIFDPEPLGGCGVNGTETWSSTSMPLSDASFLLVFLLGIYGIYTYRKRRGTQIELIEK